jgi:hypothetical protein
MAPPALAVLVQLLRALRPRRANPRRALPAPPPGPPIESLRSAALPRTAAWACGSPGCASLSACAGPGVRVAQGRLWGYEESSLARPPPAPSCLARRSRAWHTVGLAPSPGAAERLPVRAEQSPRRGSGVLEKKKKATLGGLRIRPRGLFPGPQTSTRVRYLALRRSSYITPGRPSFPASQLPSRCTTPLRPRSLYAQDAFALAPRPLRGRSGRTRSRCSPR